MLSAFPLAFLSSVAEPSELFRVNLHLTITITNLPMAVNSTKQGPFRDFCSVQPETKRANRAGVGVRSPGYSENIVVDEAFVLIVPRNLNPAAVAPLLYVGITTYSPLKHWNVSGPG
jgi:hypothetical protein